MKMMMLSVLAACAVSVAASAQEVSTYTFERKIASEQAPQVLLDKISLNQAKVAVQARTTPNAPYSAEATTESVMALADGNRIVRKTTTRVYRDSAGRMRQEIVGADGQVATVIITDPVASTSYVVDPRAQTASQKMQMAYFAVRHSESAAASGQAIANAGVSATSPTWTVVQDPQAGVAASQQSQKHVVVTATEGSMMRIETSDGSNGEVTKEDLGEQTIDGVVAKGTRTTTVIPAGAVDNEQPIKIVSEEWFSPELQILLMTKHSDPRVGDTTYRVTNVTRTEPARSLFELPAGITVKTPEGVGHVEIRKHQ
jgi:hypothetical protein